METTLVKAGLEEGKTAASPQGQAVPDPLQSTAQKAPPFFSSFLGSAAEAGRGDVYVCICMTSIQILAFIEACAECKIKPVKP